MDLSDTTAYLTVSQDDLNLYFANTFLYIEGKSWEYVDNIGMGANCVLLLNSGSLNPLAVHSEQVKFSFPEVGLYNYKKGVISFRRRTARQNKKALCKLTGEVFNILGLFNKFFPLPYGFALSQTWKWSQRNLNSTFVDIPFPDFDQAYSGVTKLKDFAKAIDRNFFLGQGISSKAPSLWFRETLIGKCPKKNQIVIDNPAFLQEAIDFFMPRGLSVETSNSAL